MIEVRDKLQNEVPDKDVDEEREERREIENKSFDSWSRKNIIEGSEERRGHIVYPLHKRRIRIGTEKPE